MSIENGDKTLFGSWDEDKPLIPPGGCGEGEGRLVYDETGELSSDDPTPTPVGEPTVYQPPPHWRLRWPCSLETLDGSWKLSITPEMHRFFWGRIRGPMRIEAANNILRASGDIYVSRFPWTTNIGKAHLPTVNQPPATLAQPAITDPIVSPINPQSLIIRRNWYPAYPQDEYRWYFRSTSVTYKKSSSVGTLRINFIRHLWNTSTEEFVGTDSGWMEFKCSHSLIRVPWLLQPTIKIEGEAMIGGYSYRVSAVKTSPYYRGCKVEVDVMQNRSFPSSATQCGGLTYNFAGIYRSHGIDVSLTVDEVDVPEDLVLTRTELHTLLADHRSPPEETDKWRLWVLVGSTLDGGGGLGVMFDHNPPHREGVAAFYDPRFPAEGEDRSELLDPSVRGERAGDVPTGFLRTLVHEAGHAFNLYHPNVDCHGIPSGRTIMNQTGRVMDFATSPPLYPCNAIMAFNEHNRTSLIHSPDPQVKPGWKQFGWGHDSFVWCGLQDPADVMGLYFPPTNDDLHLELKVPDEVFPGELILADFTVTNVSDHPVPVSTALNLSEGYLLLYVTDPQGGKGTVSDIVHLDTDGRMQVLQPGESQVGTVQILYTNRGFKFDRSGRYEMHAELPVMDGTGSVVRSDNVELVVRPAVTEQERKLRQSTMDADVGASLAFGDFGPDPETKEKVAGVADEFSDTDTGAAFAMVMANSLGRDFNDPQGLDMLREADESGKDHYFDIATKGRTLTESTQMATAVVGPRDLDAPLLQDIEHHIEDQRYKEEDRDQAQKVYDDFTDQ